MQSLRDMLKESLRYTAFLGSFAGVYVAVDESIAALLGKRRCAPRTVPWPSCCAVRQRPCVLLLPCDLLTPDTLTDALVSAQDVALEGVCGGRCSGALHPAHWVRRPATVLLPGVPDYRLHTWHRWSAPLFLRPSGVRRGRNALYETLPVHAS